MRNVFNQLDSEVTKLLPKRTQKHCFLKVKYIFFVAECSEMLMHCVSEACGVDKMFIFQITF